MSTLEPHTQGLVVPRHIGRRITEIMDEKGKAFTQQAIAIRIGMNKQTLSKKLRGDRDLYMFELRRVAEALNLTVERVMQEDTIDLETELKTIFEALIDPRKVEETAKRVPWSEAATEAYKTGGDIEVLKLRALEIAKHLSSVALGVTEKCNSLNQLGRAYFHLQKSDEAHHAWLEAYEHAKKLANKNGKDTDVLFKIITNLTISYSNRNEFSQLSAILSEIHPFYKMDNFRSAIIYYSLAKIEEQKGNLIKAKELHYNSLNIFRLTEHKKYTARSLHNTACFEFRLGNYESSKNMFLEAIQSFTDDLFENLVCLKEYTKTLLKLGENSEAKNLILSAIKKLESLDSNFVFRNLKSQFLIILSITTNEAKFAESVIGSDVDITIKNIAYRFLMDFYSEKDDSHSVMKYYRMARNSLSNEKRDILYEGGL